MMMITMKMKAHRLLKKALTKCMPKLIKLGHLAKTLVNRVNNMQCSSNKLNK